MSDDPTVAVVGSYNVGLTMTVPRFPVPGETVSDGEFFEVAGGKGSNQAVAAARLGASTRFVGRVGDDGYAADAREMWAAEGVDDAHVSTDSDEHTGAGFVVVDESGENMITVAPGANHELDADDVRAARDAIADADALLCQMEIPDGAIAAAVEVAAESDTTVVFNPAPARAIPAGVLADVDYLTPNRSEARVLVGADPEADVDDEAVARELLERGVGAVVMTLGADGALVVTERGTERVPTVDVDVVDTTGAGDAFNGALAVALSEGLSVADAAEFACRAGALATTEAGVVPGLPSRDAVE
ncbi:MAG: ribokinase, partial [Halobacteriaceae archaeon]